MVDWGTGKRGEGFYLKIRIFPGIDTENRKQAPLGGIMNKYRTRSYPRDEIFGDSGMMRANSEISGA